MSDLQFPSVLRAHGGFWQNEVKQTWEILLSIALSGP